MSTPFEPPAGSFQRMGGLLMGHVAAQCVYAVAVLGIADLLASGPKTIEALASATGCDPSSLQRVLRVLVRFDVFAEAASGSFELTSVGATLRSDAPASQRDAAIFVMSTPLWRSFGAILDTLRSGDPAFVSLHNATIFEYLAQDNGLRATFHSFQTAQSNMHNAAILEAYDFSDIRTIVDVGGGQGATLAAILHRYPAMNGILFDLPEVVATSPIKSSDLNGRCQICSGDMLHSVQAAEYSSLISCFPLVPNLTQIGSRTCLC